jgi:hypothetical protein
MRRCLLILAAVVSVSAAGTALATHPPDGVVRYRILRNGSPIGTHRVRFRSAGDRMIVQHRIRIRVSVIGFEAYRYDLHSRETWRGDRLVALHSRTEKNGASLEVMASGMRRGIRIYTRDGTARAPSDAVVASPSWDVLARRPARMIDSETGQSWSVRVSAAVEESLRVAGEPLPCRRYRVRGDLDATLWYDRDGILAKKRLTAPDGSTIVTVRR